MSEPGERPQPRVLMLLKRSGGLGGLQVQAGRVTLGLKARGLPVSLLTLAPPARTEPVWWARQIPSHFLPASSQWGFALSAYRWLCRERERYDLVHVHGLAPETYAAMAARGITGRPLVVKPGMAGPGTRLHSLSRWSRALPPLSRKVWQRVDRWISISSETRKDLLNMGVPDARIAPVPNGVDWEVYHPLEDEARSALRTELGLRPEELLVCTVVRLTPQKRVGMLVRVFLELAGRFPHGRLWVIGSGEEQPQLEALAGAHAFGQRVHFLGRARSDRVARILQSTDIFVLWSAWEGLSNALLEAMACGVACTVTDVSGMRDVVTGGASGLVVPPDDPEAARLALTRLLESGELRQRLGAEAAETIRSSFSLESTVEQLLRLYCSLCGGPGMPGS